MESYCLSIHSHEDFDLIENYEEREEAQDNFYDENRKWSCFRYKI